MKTFTGKQLLFYIGATALVVFFLMLGFGAFSKDGRRNRNIPEPPEEKRELSELYLEQSDFSSFDEGLLSEDLTADERLNIEIYERLNPGVVNITTEVIGYNWMLEPVPTEGSTGSGAVIDSRGYVLTNCHVVEGAYKVYLTLADGSQYLGEVIGQDKENDLALISFNPEGKELVTIPLGDSDDLMVGQKVLAIGNPYGLERTLTTGIVSGLGRPLRNKTGLIMKDMIQTDASINPGNSGGPLIDTSGQMIGINTMIYSPSGGSVGIGFAVPVDTAKRILPDLINYGYVQRGWIDIDPVQIFPSLVRYGDLPVSQGILVSRVKVGSLADEAGLRGGNRQDAVRTGNSVIYLGGDIIIGIDDQPVTNYSTFFQALEETKPGDIVELKIIRGRREMVLELELSERPEDFPLE